MSNIRDNINHLLDVLPSYVTLVAVSKNHSIFEIMEAFSAGQRVFGENRVQELISKQPLLPAEIEWHLVGHLQTNKVKYIVPFIKLIHSIDSPKLLREVNKEAIKANKQVDCLLQFHIAAEESKYGFLLEEAVNMLNSTEREDWRNVCLCGVMGMATFTDDTSLIRQEFRTLKSIFDQLKEEFFKNDQRFSEISMGMSADYSIAIEEGSTIVRVGSAIFGER